MKKIPFDLPFFLFLVCVLTVSVFAQNPKPDATPPIDKDSDVVKISTTLIQLDVIVTDKKGNQVTDLKPEDFEIYENGKKQDISNFSYISLSSNGQPTDYQVSKQTPKKTDKQSVPPPAQKLQLEKIRRTYAIVVDDLGLSFDNVYWVQQNLKKFINEQMQNGDLVAIIRTGSGSGALQSFTNDKRQLLAAINKLRWNPQGRGGISTFAAIGSTLKEDLQGMKKSDGSTRNPAGNEQDKEFQDQITDFRNENFSVGTLGALSYIIRGMHNLPGRKSLMLVSEGFQMIQDRKPTRILNAMRVLADLANRSSVVIYTLDPRGLQVPEMYNAEDNVGIIVPNAAAGTALAIREEDFQDSVQSLRYLAYETGGIPYVNQNNIGRGLRKVLEDQSGYYLIGYQPDAETFDPKKNKFNKLSVKIKREGLKVRHRSGFFGITDKRMAEVKQTPQQQIYSALTSPFGKNDISLSVNTLFAENEKGGSFIRSLVNIDARDLKFSQEPDGTHKANFDIIAMTFGDNGVPVDEAAKNYTIRVGEKVYQKILQKGFVYNLLVPIKKPGAYQFRIAMRDSATAKVGSASQFVDVPNLKKDNLTLSGIVLDNFTADEWKKISHGENTAVQTADEAGSDADTALRIFKRGTVLRYDYLIYNAKTNPSQLQIQARLFRDGKILFEGQPSAFDTSGQTDLKRLQAVGAITLGNNLAPGNYVLQLIVKDGLAKEKRQIATGSVDFEIVD
jgi:VWFA-related protein